MAQAQARQRYDWSHTSSLLALLANCHAAKGHRFTPADFDPTIERRRVPAPFSVLKSAFVRD